MNNALVDNFLETHHWEHHTGRLDGDKYLHYSLVENTTGRILARIVAPVEEGEYVYSLYFRCNFPTGPVDKFEPWEFTSLDYAKEVAEAGLTLRHIGEPEPEEVWYEL